MFPTDQGTAPVSLDDAFRSMRKLAGVVKVETFSLRQRSAAGTMTSGDVLNYATILDDMRIQLTALATLGQPLASYAQSLLNDNSVNIVTEYNSMLTAMNGVTSWIVTNFPKTPTTNELRAKVFAPENNGRTVDVVFTAGATANLRTTLDALLATLN